MPASSRAGSTPVRRSTRSTAGKTPARLGQGDGWSTATNTEWSSKDGPSPSPASSDDPKKPARARTGRPKPSAEAAAGTLEPGARVADDQTQGPGFIKPSVTFAPLYFNAGLAFIVFTLDGAHVLPRWTEMAFKVRPVTAVRPG